MFTEWWLFEWIGLTKVSIIRDHFLWFSDGKATFLDSQGFRIHVRNSSATKPIMAGSESGLRFERAVLCAAMKFILLFGKR